MLGLLGERDVVADTELGFEVERRAAASQLTVVHDADAITQLIGLIH